MAIDPSLRTGIDAYRRADFTAARTAFESFAEAADGAECDLGLTLVRLTAALEEQQSGQREVATALYARLPELLDALPDRLLGVDLAALAKALPESVAEALASPPPLAPARRLTTGAIMRFAILLAILAAAFAAVRWGPLAPYMERERIVALLDQAASHWWAPLVLILLYMVTCPLGLPATPLVFAGAAVFGTVTGGLLNVVGTVAGAATSYLLARYLGHDMLVSLAGDRLAQFEKLLARYGFWNLVRIRLVPVPFPVINFGAALAGVPFRLFITTSAIGLTPAVLIYSWFASSLIGAATGAAGHVLRNLLIALVLALGLSFLPTWVRGLVRRRRYRRLLEARRRERVGRGR